MSIDSMLKMMQDQFGDRQSMPFIQYVNRRGFFMPLAQAEALADSLGIDVPQIGNLTNVLLGDNDVPGFLTKALDIAPIETRFRWNAEAGRGKRQVYALVKAKVGEKVQFVGPVIITTAGLASKELGDALKEHRSKLGSLRLSQIVPLHLGVGPATPTGYGSSKRTPIVWQCGTKEEYVGDETAQRIMELIPEAEAWRNQWKKQKQEKEEAPEPAEEEASEVAPAPEPELAAAGIPF